ncbi:MAG: hypothetical protein AAFU71_12000 [Cyanobacteria bacterium J06632_22]
MLVSPPSAAVALGLQTDLTAEQPAVLVSPKPNTPVPLYLRPAPNQQNVGYGPDGGSVTVLEQAGDYFGGSDPQTTWNHIRLDSPPYTEGWLEGKYLSFQAGALASEQNSE